MIKTTIRFPGCEYEIEGVSYIGNPRSLTAMFLVKKLQPLLESLRSVQHCVVFLEKGMSLPKGLDDKHFFVFSENPQLDYANFAISLNEVFERNNRTRKYLLISEGYYLGENVKIGPNALIEPGCIIGHDVTIGKNATILAGTVIKNATIGDDFLANENAVIGANGFTFVKDNASNLIRVPSLGNVIIGNHVEIGTVSNISRGSAGDTVICDYVKLDALVHVAHDVHMEENVEAPAGVIFGGFTYVESGVFVGVNSSIRNRVRIGKDSIIGMGAVVTKNVEPESIVIGNPAKPMKNNC